MTEQASIAPDMANRLQEGTNAGAQSGIYVECVWRGPAILGECPLWDHRSEQLLWIDSLGKKIWHHCPASGETGFIELAREIGSIGLRAGGGLVAGLDNGFHFVDLDTGETRFIADPEPDITDTRLNDGKCDRAGRFWCGSMNVNFTKDNASLYRLDPDLSWHTMDTGFTVSNGIAWSPNDRVLYFSDSRLNRSYAYDFDIETGEISNRRNFANTSTYAGRIDGATVDRDGNYWGALFEGAAIACFSPGGDLIRKIEMRVTCPTMCNFGGRELDVLYVTSAIFTMSHEELEAQPQAGGLFAISGLDVRGVPEPEFGG